MERAADKLRNDTIKVFVASSFLNRANAAALMHRLSSAGYTITFDWTREVIFRTHKQRQEKALRDFHGVVEADILVVLWPGRLGTSTEIGIALARDIPIILIWPDLDSPARKSVYFNHPNVKIVSTEARMFRLLERERRRRRCEVQ